MSSANSSSRGVRVCQLGVRVCQLRVAPAIDFYRSCVGFSPRSTSCRCASARASSRPRCSSSAWRLVPSRSTSHAACHHRPRQRAMTICQHHHHHHTARETSRGSTTTNKQKQKQTTARSPCCLPQTPPDVLGHSICGGRWLLCPHLQLLEVSRPAPAVQPVPSGQPQLLEPCPLLLLLRRRGGWRGGGRPHGCGCRLRGRPVHVFVPVPVPVVAAALPGAPCTTRVGGFVWVQLPGERQVPGAVTAIKGQ
jgi:hypothetical protein